MRRYQVERFVAAITLPLLMAVYMGACEDGPEDAGTQTSNKWTTDWQGEWNLNSRRRRCGENWGSYADQGAVLICSGDLVTPPGTSGSGCTATVTSTKVTMDCRYQEVLNGCQATAHMTGTYSRSGNTFDGTLKVSITFSGCDEPAECYEYEFGGTRLRDCSAGCDSLCVP